MMEVIPEHDGWLTKRSTGNRNIFGRFMLSWKRRYIILTRAEITWHEKKLSSGASCKLGSLPIGESTKVVRDGPSSSGKSFTIEISSPPHTLVLVAQNSQEQEDWVLAIEKALSPEGAKAPSSRSSINVEVAAEPNEELASEEIEAADLAEDVELATEADVPGTRPRVEFKISAGGTALFFKYTLKDGSVVESSKDLIVPNLGVPVEVV